MSQERVVRFSVRSVLTVIALVVATWALLSLIAITGQVIAWVLVSIFLALALNPAVEWFTRHGIKRRGAGRDGAVLRAHAGALAGALAEGRPRHLPHRRWLRDRQPADQPDRRDADHRRPAHPGRAVRPRARCDRRRPRSDSARRRDD